MLDRVKVSSIHCDATVIRSVMLPGDYRIAGEESRNWGENVH